MRENDGSAFALVDIGHSPALDFQELLSSERLCAIGHFFSFGAYQKCSPTHMWLPPEYFFLQSRCPSDWETYLEPEIKNPRRARSDTAPSRPLGAQMPH